MCRWFRDRVSTSRQGNHETTRFLPPRETSIISESRSSPPPLFPYVLTRGALRPHLRTPSHRRSVSKPCPLLLLIASRDRQEMQNMRPSNKHQPPSSLPRSTQALSIPPQRARPRPHQEPVCACTRHWPVGCPPTHARHHARIHLGSTAPAPSIPPCHPAFLSGCTLAERQRAGDLRDRHQPIKSPRHAQTTACSIASDTTRTGK